MQKDICCEKEETTGANKLLAPNKRSFLRFSAAKRNKTSMHENITEAATTRNSQNFISECTMKNRGQSRSRFAFNTVQTSHKSSAVGYLPAENEIPLIEMEKKTVHDSISVKTLLTKNRRPQTSNRRSYTARPGISNLLSP